MAMRQHRFTALGLALAMVLGACGSEPEDLSTPEPDETPVAEQVPTDAPANGEEDIPEAEPFESPLVEEDDEATIAAPSGLISSTNPQERSRQVQRNLDAAREEGADPFGILPVEVSRSQRQAENVTQQVTEEAESGTPEASENGRTATRTGTTTGTTTATRTGNGTATGGTATATTPDGRTTNGGAAAAEAPAPEEPPGPPLPALPMQTVDPLPDLPFESAATPRFAPEPTPVPQVPQTPPPPTADTAEAIEVSGVLQIGNEIQVILRVPNAVNSQYVRLGQNVAGGRVVVRRVENLATGSPVVILEENGIEVARAVGEPPVTPASDNGNGNGNGNDRGDFIRQVPLSDLSSGTRTLPPPRQLDSQYVVSQQ